MSPDDERDRFLAYDAYDEGEPQDECCHENYDRDDLTGRANCNYCGHHWYMSNEQVLADIRREAEYDKQQRREARREFWRKLTHPIRLLIFRVASRIWPRKASKVLTSDELDDELPF